ncbi:MAG: Rz1-like lysis system protein LysC [Stenotrophomonas sp.]|uniref:Rz1-like lysis system protein LysC n=1 Tax=Stenotrophomonas sp. TaxID=69392 RepID=UPI003D6D236E
MKTFNNGQANSGNRCRSWPALILSWASMLVLASCSTGTAVMPVQTHPAPVPPPPTLPASLVQPCPALPAAPSDEWIVLIGNHDQVAEQYHDCRSRMARLLEAAQQWEVTAWQWYCAAAREAGLTVERCPHEPSAGLAPNNSNARSDQAAR